MRSAIYYPHAQITNENILKTALLLWDDIAVIVPNHGYCARYDKSEREYKEAFDIIGKSLVPSDLTKRKAHDFVEDFATRPLPASFSYVTSDPSDMYEIYPQKFLPDTWRVLEDAGLTSERGKKHQPINFQFDGSDVDEHTSGTAAREEGVALSQIALPSMQASRIY